MSDRRAQIRAKIEARSHEEPAPRWLDPALGPCRIWDGPTSGEGRGGGYGRMNLDGQTVAVHIVSWVNEHGFLPGKKQLDHLCRRRLCWSDKHLEPVTHKQNQRRRNQWSERDIARWKAENAPPFQIPRLPPLRCEEVRA